MLAWGLCDRRHTRANLFRKVRVQRSEGLGDPARAREQGPREVVMAAFIVGVDACCPLCGSPILSVGRGGRGEGEDLHPVPLYRHGRSGEGYMLCDDCGVLAELPSDITLN